MTTFTSFFNKLLDPLASRISNLDFRFSALFQAGQLISSFFCF
jgi:hypothetical protein